jgi:hypothetical protein
MLQFLPAGIQFNCVTRAVHLIAEREGERSTHLSLSRQLKTSRKRTISTKTSRSPQWSGIRSLCNTQLRSLLRGMGVANVQ